MRGLRRVSGEERTLVEKANTVFKPTGGLQYKAVKSRNGDVLVGAIYSQGFVEAYAREYVNEYIERGDY